MKLHFRGWQREVLNHKHGVAPVTHVDNTYNAGKVTDPLNWDGPYHAFGRVDDLALNGSFLVDFDFDERELRNWLLQYAKAYPTSAIRLLAEMQGEAVLALVQEREIPVAFEEA